MIAPKHGYAAVSGSLVVAASAPVAVAGFARGASVYATPAWLALVSGSSLALCLAALAFLFVPWLGRLFAFVGVLGAWVLVWPALLLSPALALAALLVTTLAALLLARKRRLLGPRTDRGSRALGAAARAAALVAMVIWLSAIVLSPVHVGLPETLSVLFALLVSALLGMSWVVRSRREQRGRARAFVGVFGLALSGSVLLLVFGQRELAQGALALASLGVLVLVPGADGDAPTGLWDLVLGNPARLLIATFAGLCTTGTVLLMLPASGAGGHAVAPIDAAFTAVSAVCVTGLTVLDTPTGWSGFGHAMLLLLIQLGGLGIMAFSTAVMRLLGRRMSMRHEGAAAVLVSSHDRGHAFEAARVLLQFTFVTEAAGALVLLPRFLAAGHALPEAAWKAVFTAVSAFCNAGFALQGDSLVGFQRDPVALHVVALLIVLGGLSPVVALALPDLLRRRKGVLVSAQTKLVLAATAVLLVLGCVLVLALEWAGGLSHLPIVDRIHNAWFQSATLRTAGFNSIDVTALHEATWCMMILWMFIGGSPGGAAGGIKTTTAAILALAAAAAVRGQSAVVAFHRQISVATVYRAMAIVTIGLAVGFVAVIATLLTQDMPALMAVFEVASAMGTVGLSIGGTGRLDEVGKLIIMACMFAGRVGPLTLFMFLARGTQHTVWKHPTQDMDVG